MVIRGIDISDFQGTPDFSKVARQVSFVYAQATYGCQGSYWDDTFKANHDGARGVNLPFGAYHFLLFSQDPVAQAKAFLAETKDRLGTLLPMVDVENDSGTTGSAAGNVAHLAAFTDYVEKAIGGKKMLIYTGFYAWQDLMDDSDGFAGHPLWIAAYGETSPVLPPAWKDWAVWQFTSGLIVEGIKGFVDADYVNGNSLGAITL